MLLKFLDTTPQTTLIALGMLEDSDALQHKYRHGINQEHQCDSLLLTLHKMTHMFRIGLIM